jgi:mono/diheme cytochrome c family protein
MFTKLNLLLVFGIVVCLGLVLFLRRDFSQPNYELVPERQMARSPAYGAFAPNPNFPDGMTLRRPADGTVHRGWQPPFPYQATPTDMVRAGKELTNPLAAGPPQVREQGAALYATYCQLCHGPTGMGDGPVSNRGFPAPLSFLKPQALDLKDGEMFHIITLGKGNMPAHALQLSETERWAVIVHVRVLQDKFTEVPSISLAKTMEIYKAECVRCHWQDGSGSIKRGELPTLPDFTSLAWHLSKTNLEITNRISFGDEPLMPAFRYKLSRDQILGLTIYLRSFARKEGTPAAPLPSTAGLEPVQIYRAYCMACHNADGRGDIVRPGMPDIPDLTSAAWHASKKQDELAKAILSGGKFMPAMKDKLTLEIAEKMVTFIRDFKDGKVVPPESQDIPVEKESPRLPILATTCVGLLGPPQRKVTVLTGIGLLGETIIPTDKVGKDFKDQSESPEMAKRLRAAAAIFRQYCIACHGPDGTGVAAMRGALPTLPDFTKLAFHEQHSDSQLLISILDGKGTLMPANRGRINEGQALDLVAFVRTFGPKGFSTPVVGPSDFQRQFDELQRQWDALQNELKALKKKSSNP